MKKVLFVASVIGHIETFHLPALKMFKEKGYAVSVMANGVSKSEFIDNSFDIPFDRFPITKGNFKNYFKIKKIIYEEQPDIISCHTPAASVLIRLAARNLNTTVVYMAHGFHFYNGGSIFNNILYKTIERVMAKYTDKIITINNEDYEAAQKFHLKKNGKVYYVPGVGIDIENINKVKSDRKQMCINFGLDEKSFIIISVGELNQNKNHIAVLKALKEMKNKNISYIICGSGIKYGEYEKFINEEKLSNVRLLGFRNDVISLMKSSDLLIFPSFREGLPVSIMEGMAAGLPVIASNIRGCKDLVKNDINGFLVSPNDVDALINKINLLMTDKLLYKKMSGNSLEICKTYSVEEILKKLEDVYFD